jgi:hypothetical protein
MKEGEERFVEGVRDIRSLGDVFLVANIKDPERLKLSTVEASFMLKERLGVDAAPVIVARDMNRLQFLSTVFTGFWLKLGSMMIVWGDDYQPSVHVTNTRDFATLGDAIAQASQIRRRVRSSTLLFAPVDINGLRTSKGVALAKQRLRAGADYLLAQPPTTDSGRTFDNHTSLLGASGLKDRVLLNVFPFRDQEDVRKCERYFGWTLPRSLYEIAAGGETALISEEKRIIERLRAERFPGVYVTTRGAPEVARRLLS